MTWKPLAVLPILLSFFMPTAPVAAAESAWRYGAFYFQEDRCYTAKVTDCEVNGLGVNARRAVDSYFVNFSYAHFRSPEDKLVGDLFAIGVEDEFAMGEQGLLNVFATLHFESDEDPPGNTNANGGYSIGVDFSTIVGPAGAQTGALELGVGLSYEDRQDCSNADCNELRSRRGQMDIVQARLFFKKPLRNDMWLTGALSGIVSYPDDDAFNGLEQDSPTITIGLEFRP